MPWTSDQQQAIDSRGKNLLVAAAAGSGKTAVLVERIIKLILDGECDIDRMLVVTFTNAAAAEMRARIASALTKKIDESENLDEDQIDRLEHQLIFLSNASIQTIHAFCKSLLQRNFAALDLSPRFRIGNENELAMMKLDLLEEMFEEKYSALEENFVKFTDSFGGTAIGDSRIHKLILKLYEFSQSQPFPESWLSSLDSAYDLPPNSKLTDTIWWSAAEDELSLEIEGAISAANRGIDLASKCGLKNYVDTMDDELNHFRNMKTALKQKNIPWLISELGMQFARMSGGARNLDEEKKKIRDRVKSYRERYKKIVTGLYDKYFHGETEEELIEDLRNARKNVETLAKLTLEFLQRFQTAKRSRNILDFNDLEHLTLKLLMSGGNEKTPQPSQIAEELQKKFQVVMVDEYQDVNGVQETILQLITDGENLFTVGDVKQSIYRFRLADPSLFMQKYENYPKLAEEGKSFARIDLTRNFRSREEVLESINFLFEQLMQKRTMEIDYDEKARLYFGAEYPENDSIATEFLLIDGSNPTADFDDDSPSDDLKGAAREGQLIADRIKKLIEDETQVFDRHAKKLRPFEYRDAVILLRSIRDSGAEILEILRANNIPAFTATDDGYLEDLDVRLILNLLSVIENPLQDIPLASVLTSPIVGLNYEDLARIRSENPRDKLITAIKKSTDSRIEKFLARLDLWKTFSRSMRVPDLIWTILDEVDYYDYVGALPEGILRQANLRLLVEHATDLEQLGRYGLFQFLRFMRQVKSIDSDFPLARPLSEKENVVRIMTIHQSKGLEFPVVFVAGLGKKFNMQDLYEDFLIDRDLGLGAYTLIPHGDLRFKFTTFARGAISYILERQSKAEELRTFYVALTRAREKLILIATSSGRGKLDKRIENLSADVDSENLLLPTYEVFSKSSFLDWIVMSLLRHPDAIALRKIAPAPVIKTKSRFNIEIIDGDSIRPENLEAQESDEILTKISAGEKLPSSPDSKRVVQILSWKYPFEGSADIPAKFSVTELKYRSQAEDSESAPLIKHDRLFRKPQFLSEKTLSNVEYGTLVHSILQNLDLSRDLSRQGISEQIDEMIERGIILDEHARVVKISDVEKFFESPVGLKLQKARQVFRELSFTKLLPANRFFSGKIKNSEDKILLQGIIDLLFEDESGNWILLDYKTDRDNAPDHAREKYHMQVELYSEAVEEIMHVEVSEKFLYMLHGGIVVAM